MGVTQAEAAADPRVNRARLRAFLTWFLTHPVVATMVVAGVLQLIWWAFLANSGGDIAAQDAWAQFAKTNPRSAYNFAWYGGLHPVSYSVISPYIMAWVGVRLTLMISSTISAGLTALILCRCSRWVRRPLLPSLLVAVALFGDSISGRVTFALGVAFGLGAILVIFCWPERWRGRRARHAWPRALLAALLAMLATCGSPVAGLYLGIVAAGLWLSRRHAASYAIGLPPVVVVALSALLFPFQGRDPMNPWLMAPPIAITVFVLLTSPKGWRVVRISSWVYIAFVVFAWAVETPIGLNIERFALVFGIVVQAAVLTSGQARTPFRWLRWERARSWPVATFSVVAILGSVGWNAALAASDAVHDQPASAWAYDIAPLINELHTHDAAVGRVEAVPSWSHRESAALAPYVNLARGWNRQADAERNPIFYDTEHPLTSTEYRNWLHRWAVRYVVLPPGTLDPAAVAEAALIQHGLPYLHQVWSDIDWKLYKVVDPTPVASAPARVITFDSGGLTVYVPRAAHVLLRVPNSPWLSLVDANGQQIPSPTDQFDSSNVGNTQGCLAPFSESAGPGQPNDVWTMLEAPSAGVYRIQAPYTLPRGTACPDTKGSSDGGDQ